MQTVEVSETKQQIIERLDSLSPEALRALLDYVRFISLDPASRSLLAIPYDDAPLSETGKALIQEELDDPRPGISDEDFRKELGL